MSATLYDISAVTKHYRVSGKEVVALPPLDLKINRGDFLVVSGASGSGKTTLLMLLGGMLRPTSGSIRLDGIEMYALSPKKLATLRARQIGFVFQTFHLVPYLNALENILVGALSQPPEIQSALRNRARELLERFEIADRQNHRPAELSVGQRQRIAMARALLHAPEIILADEPTGNLDSTAALGLISQLRDFNKEGGTVVLVTHNNELLNAGNRSLKL